MRERDADLQLSKQLWVTALHESNLGKLLGVHQWVLLCLGSQERSTALPEHWAASGCGSSSIRRAGIAAISSSVVLRGQVTSLPLLTTEGTPTQRREARHGQFQHGDTLFHTEGQILLCLPGRRTVLCLQRAPVGFYPYFWGLTCTKVSILSLQEARMPWQVQVQKGGITLCL